MSQSPEAYERLILDAMRGEATLFTRNDEVIAQWSIIDPILKAWHEDDRARCTRTRPARGGPAEADELIAPRQLAGPLTMTDEVWRERDTTPGAIEAALREPAGRAPPRGARVRARARDEPGRDRRRRVPRRDREPAPARRALPPVAARSCWRSSPGAQEDRRVVAASAPRTRRSRARSRSAASGSSSTIGERHLPKLDTIVDPLVVPDLATMVWAPHGHDDGGRRAAAAGADRPGRLAGRARRPGRARARGRAARRRLRRRPRLAALDAVARARRGGLRPAAAAARARRRSRGSPSATAQDSLAAGAAVLRLAVPRAWAGGPRRCSAGRRQLAGARARAAAARSSSRLEPVEHGRAGARRASRSRWPRAGVSLDRGPGGLRAVRRDRDGKEQVVDGDGRLARRGGILGEGVRQALLRDPTYKPALSAARELL